MIRDFNIDDLTRFEPNEFSDPATVPDVFKEDYQKHTLVLASGIIGAIICFKEVSPRDWAGFFLISKHFRFADATEIQDFIRDTVAVHKPKRLWTASRNHKILEGRHRLLGMEKEQTIELNNKELNIWSFNYGN